MKAVFVWMAFNLIAMCVALLVLKKKKPNICDTCEHLLVKEHCGFLKYKCSKRSWFDRPPKYCAFCKKRGNDLTGVVRCKDLDVVRCKDCGYGEPNNPDFPIQYTCHAGFGRNGAEFYCASGIRRS